MVPDALRGIDLLSVTPSHHYPTNVTLGIARRHRLLERAALDDFLIVEGEGSLHVVNAPSPAATSCLPIGEHVADRVLQQLA